MPTVTSVRIATKAQTAALASQIQVLAAQAEHQRVRQTEVDCGTLPVSEATFVIADPMVATTSHLIGQIAHEAPTGKDLDEVEMDAIDVKLAPGPSTGQFTAYLRGLEGYLAGKFKLNYVVG